MQTQNDTAHRPAHDPARIAGQAYPLFQLPRINGDKLKPLYDAVRKVVGLAGEQYKQDMSRVILSCQGLGYMDELSINRQFNRHRKGAISEQDVLTLLYDQCLQNVGGEVVSTDYPIALSLTDSHVQVDATDIGIIEMDSRDLRVDERFTLYAALELVSCYQLPMLTPMDHLQGEFSVFDEIEVDDLVALACQVKDNAEWDDYFQSDSCNMEWVQSLFYDYAGDACEAVRAVLQMEAARATLINYTAFKTKHKLRISPKGQNRNRVYKRLIKLLEAIADPFADKLALCLQRFQANPVSLDLNFPDDDDTRPLYYGLSVIDKAYESLLVYLVESFANHMYQTGEAITETLPLDQHTQDRLSLMSDSFLILKSQAGASHAH